MSDERKLCVPCAIEWEMVVIASNAKEAQEILRKNTEADLSEIRHEAETSAAVEIADESMSPKTG